MPESGRFGGKEMVLLLVVMTAAALARGWYVWQLADAGQSDGPFAVQDSPPILALPAGTSMNGHSPPTELDALLANLKEHQWFGCLAPLAAQEERTAHVAPGYPWLLYWLGKSPVNWGPLDRTVRWAQAGLGVSTVGLYFLFALRAFGSSLAAFLTGLLCALHPFWIANTTQINDGVVTTFLLALCIHLGARGAQSGAAFTSLLFGLALSGLALVRAALLPFSIVALLWFFLRCRGIRRGWLCALLAFLGCANGLTFWTIRNYKVPEWGHHLVPIADSAYYHLWVGNNPRADGGPLAETVVLATLADARHEAPATTAAALAKLNQPGRYEQLGQNLWNTVHDDPGRILSLRVNSFLDFFLGHRDGRLTGEGKLPDWLAQSYIAIFRGALLLMLSAGLLGWRWTYGWKRESMPAALALVWVTVPYVLSHGELLFGPRIPLDGVLLCYTAFALSCIAPSVGRRLLSGGQPSKPASERGR